MTSRMHDGASIAVVGAGWSGCAAAVELAAAGHKVTLIDSSRTPGGRARTVDIDGKTLDNGQHILLGAYSETLRLFEKTGVDARQALLRVPLQMRYPRGYQGMEFVAARWPAPLHLLSAVWCATGLSREDKMALARFSSTARWMRWELNEDCSVDELLLRFDQTERLIALLWRPLCIAALNTPPERASARVFLHVLRDSLGGRRAHSDMLIPRVDLGALFPIPAATFVEENGGHLRLGHTVRSIDTAGQGWRLQSNNNDSAMCVDGLVIATSASQAALLVNGITHSHIPEFDHEPITTCYLQYPAGTRLDHPFFALSDDVSRGHWGQFVFDRGQLDPMHDGLLAVVVSASASAIVAGHDSLAAAIAMQLAAAFEAPHLANPVWRRVISEKRATFSCTPGLQRPVEQTDFPTLTIAGDYVASDYPATLESAVRSGVKAARLLCDHFRIEGR